jgi:hypothetical protein
VVEKRDEELKDREAYIRQLEESLRSQHLVPSRKKSAKTLKPAAKPATAHLANGITPSPLARNIPLPESPAVLTVDIRDEDDASGVKERENSDDESVGEDTREKELQVKVEDETPQGAAEVAPLSEMSPTSSQRFNDLKNTFSALASLGQSQTTDEEVQGRIDTLLR